MNLRQELKGAGIGLRAQHYTELFDAPNKPIPWLEVLADNFMAAGGPALANLERARSLYPISFHCVGMSLGSSDPLNRDYFHRLKQLVERFQPAEISDHLAWVGVNGRYVHELVPMPYTRESLQHISARVDQVQNLLGRRILIENPSAYLSYRDSEIHEAEFLNELCQRTDCGILLDVNNIHVSASNNGFSANDYLSTIDDDRVKEIHLAGYAEMDGYLFDTHGQRVHPPVWDLYRQAIDRLGPIPTLIEWDTDIPGFSTLHEEAQKAQAVLDARTEAA
jgi:uncharacterized protein (UPF0276 family)